MPLHDWTRVPSGLFHHFHQSWSIRIADALNAGRLPEGTIALVEQRSGPRDPDVLAIEARAGRGRFDVEAAGLATMEPPVTQIVHRSDKEIYAGRANRIVIRHHLGRIVAVIEILSPGNKDTRAALRDFVDKTAQFLREGIHVLVADLFPPTRAIRKEFTRRFGMKWATNRSRFLPARTARSFPMKRATTALPMSSRWPLATCSATCPYSSAAACTWRSRWSRRTSRPGTSLRKNSALPWKPVSCRNQTQTNSGLTERS